MAGVVYAENPFSLLNTQLGNVQAQIKTLQQEYLTAAQAANQTPSLTNGEAAAAAAQAIATFASAQQLYNDEVNNVSQATTFIQAVYTALGLPTTTPANVALAKIQQLLKASTAVTTTAQAPAAGAAAQSPQGYVAMPVAAGLALGALIAGSLGGWYAKGKVGTTAKENPLLETTPAIRMEQGMALKFDKASSQWQDVMVGASVVNAAKFVGHRDIDGDNMALFRTPSGGVYAQTAVGPRAKKPRELPARTSSEG